MVAIIKENHKPPLRRSIRTLLIQIGVALVALVLLCLASMLLPKQARTHAITTTSSSNNAVPNGSSIKRRVVQPEKSLRGVPSRTNTRNQSGEVSLEKKSAATTSPSDKMDACSWTHYTTTKKKNLSNDCTVWVHPDSSSSEGVAHWVSIVVMGHIVAASTSCQLLIDYHAGIDLSQMLEPPSNTRLDWRLQDQPPPPECQTTDSNNHPCIIIGASSVPTPEVVGFPYNGPMPYYRHAYTIAKTFLIQHGAFASLEQAVPGFHVQTGFSCSFHALFRLSPKLQQYEPRLFTEILPTLHQQNTLVLSLYIRSGQTEKVGTSGSIQSTSRFSTVAQPTIDCAKMLESKLLLPSHYENVIWMVVTDAPAYKTKISNEYTTDTRKVLYTDSRGAHSKPNRDPSQADFAQAFIDWWLIGEASDAVVTHSFGSGTYGDTGALRKMVPYYKADGKKHTCTKQGVWLDNDEVMEM